MFADVLNDFYHATNDKDRTSEINQALAKTQAISQSDNY